MQEPELYDSEDDALEDLYDEDDADGDVDADADGDGDMEDDQGDAILNMGQDDGGDDGTTDGDDDSATEDSDEEEEDEDQDEDDEDEDDERDPSLDLGLTEELPPPPSDRESSVDTRMVSSSPQAPTSPARRRSLSPAHRRRKALAFPLVTSPRSFIVEAICAIPHPVPTHALASSACMTHLLTGSDDGYIRDYDIFAAVNSKNFLTAPQRQHAGVVEGLMKSGQLRFWWENPSFNEHGKAGLQMDGEPNLAPVYSLTMQSDALWALAGTNTGNINLFTLRHDPGKLCHVMNGHNRMPVSSLCMDYDEKGYFSGGWDGVAIQWDLNTGQNVRNFTAHNAYLTGVALRPMAPYFNPTPTPIYHSSQQATTISDQTQQGTDAMEVSPVVPADENTEQPNFLPKLEDSSLLTMESDTRSDASFDPLFDDVPEEPSMRQQPTESKLAIPGTSQVQSTFFTREPVATTIPPPKGAPPLIDATSYQTYSADILLTAFIDGQVILWDRRVQTSGRGVGRLWMNEKTPPWCLSACWSADGSQIYAGRRNGTVDVWDVRVLGQSGPVNTPRLMKTLRNPASSGVVSCVVPFPDCRHLACASVDNIRLWNVADSVDSDGISKSKSGVQFRIIPGHHGGYISQMVVDPGCRFLVSASSNRGLHGDSTRTVFVHDIKRLD